MRKKILEAQKQEEMEREALKERIKKANVDRDAARILKAKDEERNAKLARRQADDDKNAQAEKEAEE